MKQKKALPELSQSLGGRETVTLRFRIYLFLTLFGGTESTPGLGVQGLGLRVQGVGCNGSVRGFRIQGVGCNAEGPEFRVQGVGSNAYRVAVRGFRV